MMKNFGKEIVRLEGIGKVFPGVVALKDVQFSVRQGEVRALVGENGAGKTTLIKVLTGAHSPTAGRIHIDGQPVSHMTCQTAEKLGIACVYQNLMLAEHLTVAENIWLGNMPSRFGILNRKQLVEKTNKILDHIGYSGVINPLARVKSLTASQQGMVAIVRAISRNARIIIFDEPTAVLADREVEELFRVISQLRREGLALIYISHRLDEIFKICDTVTVLRDGQHIGDEEVENLTEDKLIAMMVGRDINTSNFDAGRQVGKTLLRVNGLSNDTIRQCSFDLKSGEIVGLYGLVGAGRTELSRAIFGCDPVTEGTVEIMGQPQRFRKPRHAIDAGIGLIPEDRRRQGLALKLSVKHNINLPVYRRHAWGGIIIGAREKQVSDRYIKQLRIRTPGDNQLVRNLSGGNQQKVVLGKWLAGNAKIFIMDEPTNGVDVGAKEEIYSLVNKLAHDGVGVLFISSYMPELMDLCDRILVMNQGRIMADVPRQKFSEDHLLNLAIKT
ncbi:sugar ABC transporter ATP-binding protein [Planctomycetota bacterium]